MKKGLTLLELIMVVIILAILASLAYPIFTKTKERALDKEAQANLRLIQAAEKIYRMEVGHFYPDSGSESDEGSINDYLKLALPAQNWDYAVNSGGNANATYSGRTWTLAIGSDTSTCTGTGCP